MLRKDQETNPEHSPDLLGYKLFFPNIPNSCSLRFFKIVPEHPAPAFSITSNVKAFPINVMAFPINGMAPGLAAAPGHGQVALGTNKVALDLGSPVWGCAPLYWPPAPWPWRCRQAWRHSINWERHSINWERHNINWERHNIRWKRRGGVGLGGLCCVFSYCRTSRAKMWLGGPAGVP